MPIPAEFTQYLRTIELPKPNSHKGQNGKVMVIGGSELFHAASQWALTVVSRMVDMTFYSSIPSNNELIHEAKKHFHNGIVVPRDEIENYIDEAEVVLIGPGMERGKNQDTRNKIQTKNNNLTTQQHNYFSKPTDEQWNDNTEAITNYLLSKYPNKKWVIDAGALQMIDPKLLNKNCIITPHIGEFETVMKKIDGNFDIKAWSKKLNSVSRSLNLPPSTTLLKGPTDYILSSTYYIPVSGGNVGMTKGGTGDVLAGLVAGLYCFTNDPFSAAVIGSYVNKKAGDELYKTVGPFFNATDLANQIPQTLAEVFDFV